MDYFPNQRLTAVISDVQDCREKLWYNRNLFDNLRRGSPDEQMAQGFALIDYAQASVALHGWVRHDIEAGRAPSIALRGKDLGNWLNSVIRWSNPLRAIANGAKHRKNEDPAWRDGWNTMTAVMADGSNANLSDTFVNDQLAAAGIALLRAIRDGKADWHMALTDENGTVDTILAVEQNYADWHAFIDEHFAG